MVRGIRPDGNNMVAMKKIMLKIFCICSILFCSYASAELSITFEPNPDPNLIDIRATHIPTQGDDECMWQNYACYAEGSNTATPASWFTSPCNNCYGTAWGTLPASMLHPAGGTVNHFAGSYLGGRGGSRVIFRGLKLSNAGQWFCVGIANNINFKSKGVHKQCGLIPNKYVPPVPTCSINPASIQLNHGSLSVSQVQGHKASQWIALSCSSAATVRIRATNVVGGYSTFELRAADKLSNILTVDNVDGASGKTYNAGTSAINILITSELLSGGKSIIAGAFSGSAVMVFDII